MEFLVAHGAALLFYLFAGIMVASAVVVITARNPIYGAFGLLATFIAVAALFLLRHAEFLALVQVFVYGGGIMVLFLFVIMLVNLHRLHESKVYGAHAPLAVVLALALVVLFGSVITNVGFGTEFIEPEVFLTVDGSVVGNTQAVAWALYREYLLPFEIASLFLLVAMIGAVVLGRRN
jgi:NADH-quinone oxidoreductase subunit J